MQRIITNGSEKPVQQPRIGLLKKPGILIIFLTFTLGVIMFKWWVQTKCTYLIMKLIPEQEKKWVGTDSHYRQPTSQDEFIVLSRISDTWRKIRAFLYIINSSWFTTIFQAYFDHFQRIRCVTEHQSRDDIIQFYSQSE